MHLGSALIRLGRRPIALMVLALVVVGVVLAVATGHHTVVSHAATAIEYGL